MKKKSRNTRRVKKRNNKMNTQKNILKNKQSTRRKNKQRTRRKNKQRTRKKNKVLYSKKYNSDKRKIIDNYTGGSLSQSVFNLSDKFNILVKVMPSSLKASWLLSIPVKPDGELDWPKQPSREPTDDEQFLTRCIYVFRIVFPKIHTMEVLNENIRIILGSAEIFFKALKSMQKYLINLNIHVPAAVDIVNRIRRKIWPVSERDRYSSMEPGLRVLVSNLISEVTGEPTSRTLIQDLFKDLFKLTEKYVLPFGTVVEIAQNKEEKIRKGTLEIIAEAETDYLHKVYSMVVEDISAAKRHAKSLEGGGGPKGGSTPVPSPLVFNDDEWKAVQLLGDEIAFDRLFKLVKRKYEEFFDKINKDLNSENLLYYYWCIFFNTDPDNHYLPGMDEDKKEAIKNLFGAFNNWEEFLDSTREEIIPQSAIASSPGSSPATSVSSPASLVSESGSFSDPILDI